MIAQVLGDGEVEIESARLEHHPEAAQRLSRMAVDVEAENADPSSARGKKPRHQREKRGLAGAVEAEQRGATPSRHREAHIVERQTIAIGVRHMLDREGGLASDVGHGASRRLSSPRRQSRGPAHEREHQGQLSRIMRVLRDVDERPGRVRARSRLFLVHVPCRSGEARMSGPGRPAASWRGERERRRAVRRRARPALAVTAPSFPRRRTA